MKHFEGKVLFLDRSDINTDEIIPAKYLTEISKDALQPFLLEDLKLEGFNPKTDLEKIGVIVTRENFGCGSSREHAPWALEANGINVVLAESFARIFRQNMFNCGMLAVELEKQEIDTVMTTFEGTDCQAKVSLESRHVTFSNATKELTFSIVLSGFDMALVNAGGWVEYADKHY